MRIGHGFDVHAFEDGDHLMLCGVMVPHNRQFKAHSDGDVAIHALCDALLGAVALGDIGQLFPDSDKQYQGMDSRFFLREIMAMVGKKGYQVENIDLTIIAQEPRLAKYIPSMRMSLAQDLGVEVDRVNVKATTTEQLGFIGEKQGIAAHSVALLSSK